MLFIVNVIHVVSNIPVIIVKHGFSPLFIDKTALVSTWYQK